MSDVQIGSIIQVKPQEDGGPVADWAGAVLIVSEVRTWGVIAYLRIPLGGNAYIRLKSSEFEATGAVARFVAP